MGLLEWLGVCVGACLLALVTYAALHKGHGRGVPAPEEDGAVQEAKDLREEASRARIRIDATITVERPSADEFARKMDPGRDQGPGKEESEGESGE